MILQSHHGAMAPRTMMPNQTTPPRGAFPTFVAPLPLDLTHVSQNCGNALPLGVMDPPFYGHHPHMVSAIDVQAARALQELCNAAAKPMSDLPRWTSLHHEPPAPVTRTEEFPPSARFTPSPTGDSISPRERFMAEVTQLASANGTPLVRVPEMGSQPLDLYELYQRVTARGGLNVVVTNKLWKPVAKELGIPLGSCTDYGYRLRRHYVRYLLAYEELHLSKEDGARKKRAHRVERRHRDESSPMIDQGGPPNKASKTADEANPYSKHAVYRSTVA